MKYGCIGEHLPHSFSREIHGKIGGYEYELRELGQKELGKFLLDRDFLAVNVTIPYKEAVIPYLDSISERAKAIGAVNTVINRGGKLFGDNTDFYGMTRLCKRLGVPLRGLDVLILGTGGTSRTAAAVAKSLGAACVTRVSRTAKDGAISYEEAYETHSGAEYIINTTPCGMFPASDACPVEPERFAHLRGVLDAVYNPLRTELVCRARAMKIPATGGLYMLVAQAVCASEIFFDRKYEDSLTEEIFRGIAHEKENVVLSGMPGCGKTSVGQALARLLHRDFIDLDWEIERFTGKTIPQIFEACDETGFRDAEEQVLREVVAPKTGCVLALGGGAVLRDSNVQRLRHNGRIYFLDRPLAELLPTPDRPTASTAEAICKRYDERYKRYLATCDQRVTVNGVETTAQRIADDFSSDLHMTEGKNR